MRTLKEIRKEIDEIKDNSDTLISEITEKLNILKSKKQQKQQEEKQKTLTADLDALKKVTQEIKEIDDEINQLNRILEVKEKDPLISYDEFHKFIKEINQVWLAKNKELEKEYLAKLKELKDIQVRSRENTELGARTMKKLDNELVKNSIEYRKQEDGALLFYDLSLDTYQKYPVHFIIDNIYRTANNFSKEKFEYSYPER